MRALALVGRGKFELRDVPEPKLKPGHVLLAPRYVGICGTDVHVYLGEFEKRIPYPAILGHEFAGVIVEPGEAKGLKKGMAATFDPVLPCGKCGMCQVGKLNQCLEVKTFGLDTDGAMAELVSLPAERVYPLPEAVGLREAPMVELYTVAVHALRRAQLEPAETVVVLGAGRLGLSLIDVIARGSPLVLVAVDLSDERLKIALKLGATHSLNVRKVDAVSEVKRLTDGLGADLVIEAVGDPEEVKGRAVPMRQAIEMLRPAGRILAMGQGEREQSFPWRQLVLKEASVVTSRTSLGEMPRALRLMEEGKLHPEVIITHEVGIGEAPEVFARLAKHEKSIVKAVVDVSNWA